MDPTHLSLFPDLDGRVLIDKTARTLSDKGAAVLEKCLLPPGAVLMSCIATVGKCGITTRPSFTNQQINSVIPKVEVDSRFLYYVFTQLGQELESTGGGGSVYTNVSKSRFSDIEVLIPIDLTEQRVIAQILSTLDDKIELNRRMNETLEAMARALFKSWFVRFPTPSAPGWRAATPACPGTSPTSSPTGWWNPSWERFQRGGRSRPLVSMSPTLTQSAFPFQVRSAPNEKARIPITVQQASWIMLTTISLMESTFFLEKTVPSCVRMAWPLLSMSGGKFWVNNHAHVLQGNGAVSTEQVYLHFFFESVAPYVTGAVQPKLSQGRMNEIPFIFAGDEICQAFAGTVQRWFARFRAFAKESMALVDLRDALLPKLVSGDLRVKRENVNRP